MFWLLLDPKYPKIFPARFARRIASFPYSFACFGCKIPQKFPGALRAPDGFISLWFCLFRNPNTPRFSRRASRAGLRHFPIFLHVLDPKYHIFPARFARRIASVSYVFAASGAQILQTRDSLNTGAFLLKLHVNQSTDPHVNQSADPRVIQSADPRMNRCVHPHVNRSADRKVRAPSGV